MKRIIRLTESDLARVIKQIIKETTEIDEFFNPFKRKKNDDEHYIKVKKWMGKTNVKLISKVEPKHVNGVVTFIIDRMEDKNAMEDKARRMFWDGTEDIEMEDRGRRMF